MTFPIAGDVAVVGRVIYTRPAKLFGIAVCLGVVEADDSLYGVPAPSPFFSTPLRFAFWSLESFCKGEPVCFDIVQGNYANFAANLTPLNCVDDFVQIVGRLARKEGKDKDAEALMQMYEDLYA